MEDDDEKGDGDPEEGRQAAQVMAVTVQRQHVMLVRRRDVYFVHVDRVLQHFHVLRPKGKSEGMKGEREKRLLFHPPGHVLQHFHVMTGRKKKGDSSFSNGSAEHKKRLQKLIVREHA